MLIWLWNLCDRATDLEGDIPRWLWLALHVVAFLLALPCLLFGALVGAIAYVWERLFWRRDDY